MQSSSTEVKHLLAFIERIERLEEEKKQLADDIKDVYAEAKGTGYDVKVMRAVVARRKQDREKLAEFEAILDLYLGALGMLGDTPLGEAAVQRDLGPKTPVVAESRKSETRGDADSSLGAVDDYEDGRRAFIEGRGGIIPDHLQGKPKRANDYLRGWGSVSEMTVADRRAFKDAIGRLGSPVDLTEEERGAGYVAAFQGSDGARVSIGTA